MKHITTLSIERMFYNSYFPKGTKVTYHYTSLDCGYTDNMFYLYWNCLDKKFEFTPPFSLN